jgi:hypothetical protein
MRRRSGFIAMLLTAAVVAVLGAGMGVGTTSLAAAAPDQAAATPKFTFRGTEYVLRESQGNEYSFTPVGQEDLHTFTDMLAFNLYPAAHDEEALTTITGRVRAIAENAKATMLPASGGASGQKTDEHFFAAVIPTPHGADFDAAHFVLVEKVAVGVFYTHRAYGDAAAGAASDWAKKNSADIEQQMLRLNTAQVVSSVKNPNVAPAAAAPPAAAAANNGDLPAGTIKKGTLTSPQLMRDTMLGVSGKVGTEGCSKIDDVARYVVTPFSGAPRSRQWKEKWVVKGCGKQYPVDIEFKEDGAGGADWTIRNF